MFIKKAFLAITLFILVACAGQPQATLNATQIFQRETEEYNVFSAMILQFPYDTGEHFVVVNEATLRDANIIITIREIASQRNQTLRLAQDTVDDFSSKSSKPLTFTRRFFLRKPYALISSNENKEYTSGTPLLFYPEKLRAKYPGAGGIFSMSRAGINTNMDQSLLIVSYTCGPRCGGVWAYILEKSNGAWKVVQVIEFEVS